MKNKITIFMHRHFKRYRLRKICKALGIVPYPWQRDFALGKTDTITAPEGRATGKTTAMILRLLMDGIHMPIDVRAILRKDPDFLLYDRHRCRWYAAEIRQSAHKCVEKNIPIDDYFLRIK